jgi:hypothetical protein
LAFSSGDEYAGDWRAAHVNQIKLKLNDVGTSQGLEIHLSIGSSSNLWQYNTAFIPPSNAWGSFSVNLDDSANFTHIINFGGSFQALQNADRILVRHDLAPYMQTPNTTPGFWPRRRRTDEPVSRRAAGAMTRPVEPATPYPSPRADGLLRVRCSTHRRCGCPCSTPQDASCAADAAGTGPGRRIWMWDGWMTAGARSGGSSCARSDRRRHEPPWSDQARAKSPRAFGVGNSPRDRSLERDAVALGPRRGRASEWNDGSVGTSACRDMEHRSCARRSSRRARAAGDASTLPARAPRERPARQALTTARGTDLSACRTRTPRPRRA